jgi:hypothetical protein
VATLQELVERQAVELGASSRGAWAGAGRDQPAARQELPRRAARYLAPDLVEGELKRWSATGFEEELVAGHREAGPDPGK